MNSLTTTQNDNAHRIEWLRTMVTIRRFEERAEQLYKAGFIRGGSHSSVGEEASAVGVCAALAPNDWLVTTYRGTGHCIAKGMPLTSIMAEFFGKATGCCHGLGGTMHLTDYALGILPTSAIVGGGIPIATGAALSAKLFSTGQVCVCFFGDGASNQGAFHESLNLAAIWDLPVIYVCENNQYAVSMPIKNAIRIEDIAKRAEGYGIPGHVVDGNDVEAVYAATAQAVERARAGQGATLLELKTYRHRGHYIGDPVKYRSEAELAEYLQRDPITRLREKLMAEGVITDEDYRHMEEEANAAIERAVEFAQASPAPDEQELMRDVYA
ncbi:MAG TPA: thiamine pyrophosphate-dependent dehydrogenase E1 component subunit alpha [Anaerolineae bacterium]|nr:thiamine pyrophosphate-dependent dehydrogenase E1 component subunit alpha [Anaerolineae bacterium]